MVPFNLSREEAATLSKDSSPRTDPHYLLAGRLPSFTFALSAMSHRVVDAPVSEARQRAAAVLRLSRGRDVQYQVTFVPIRRLNLGVGENSGPMTAAWIQFPKLTIAPLSQEYTRTSEGQYRYRAGLVLLPQQLMSMSSGW